MPKPHHVSPEGLALIKRFEGFQARPLALPQGGWLIGYGLKRDEKPAPIAEKDAAEALSAEVATVAERVAGALLAPVNQAQFDALVSLAHSIGVEAFLRSDVLKRLNAGEPIAAADAFDVWRKSAMLGEPMVLDALVRRRAAEKALFLSLDNGSAPSALVQPLPDPVFALMTTPRPRPTLQLPGENGADALSAKVRTILAAEPQTAHALRPPPPQPVVEEEEIIIPSRLHAEPADDRSRLALVVLAAFGFALVTAAALGLAGQEGPGGDAWLMLAAPGFSALIVAGYYAFFESPRES